MSKVTKNKSEETPETQRLTIKSDFTKDIRPPSRLSDGRINPAYRRWRRHFGLENVAKWNSSKRGKESTQKYIRSEKGRETRRKYRSKKETAEDYAERIIANLSNDAKLY